MYVVVYCMLHIACQEVNVVLEFCPTTSEPNILPAVDETFQPNTYAV